MRGRFREVRAIALVLLAMGIFGFFSNPEAMAQSAEDAAYYDIFKFVGELAVTESVNNMIANGGMPNFDNLIVMSNAGYAEFMGLSTQAALDGLSEATGTSRGKMNLLEIHSASHLPLWFAIYDKASGLCSYLQVNPALTSMADLFSINTVEKINAEHLYANAAEYTAKFSSGIFGGNEFRIVTIMNAIAKGAPVYAARAFEFHDHYCPGVTSGILIAQYIKKNFAVQTASDSYFVQGVRPSCKEDALMVMLNATPGKSGYAVTYPADADKAKWLPEAQNAANIIYRYDSAAKKWDGVVLGYTGGETECPTYGSTVIDKLCADLWYLERMDQPELFVKEILRFELPEGVVPKDWARPGVDPMQKLGLVQ